MDITMCKGTGCPMKDKCFRTQAPQSDWQSWFVLPPFTITEGRAECEYFEKVYEKEEKKGKR